MIQGALETDGPLWGWEGNGEDDWGGTVLALLALAVVVATALALHWFGSTQHQDVARLAPTAPRAQPAQAEAVRPILHSKSKVSGCTGQRSGQGKPDPPERGQAGPAPAGAHDQGSPRGRGLASLPLKMPGEVASRGTVGQQHDTTPGAPQGDRKKPSRPDGDFLGTSKRGGTPAPLLIHFTPRSPGCEPELQVDVSDMGVRGRGRSGRRRRGDTGSGDRRGRPARLDPLRLGAAVSVWDAMDASTDAQGTQGGPGPEEGWPWVNPGRSPGPGKAQAEVSGPGRTEMRGDPCIVGERTGYLKDGDNKQAAGGSHPIHLPAAPVPSPSNPLPLSVTQAPSKGANPSASSPAPSSAPVPAAVPGVPSASTPDPGPSSSLSLSLPPVKTGATASAPLPAPSAASTPAPPPAPTPASTPAPTQASTPAPTPASTPASTPAPVPHPASLPAQAPAPTPASTPAPASPPAPTPASTPASTPAPVPHPASLPAQAPAPTPASTPAPASPPAPFPASTPALAPAPGPASTLTPTPASASTPAPARGSRSVSWEPSVGLSKGYQEGQLLTSWGNLIAMVLRSHPLPRQERPQVNAPRVGLVHSSDPSASTHSKDRCFGSHLEEAVSSLQDRHSSLGTAKQAGAGGLPETGCQPQPVSFKTNGDPNPSPSPGTGGDGSKEKHVDSLTPAAVWGPLSEPTVQMQPGFAPPPAGRQDSQPVPKSRKRSMCEIAQSLEQVVSHATLGQHQGQMPGDRASSAGSRGVLTEKQKEARKLMVFLQRSGSWGVVEGVQNPHSQASESTTVMTVWPQQLDLGSCLEVLAFAQQHREPGLAQETYALMSSNLLRVLGDPHLYRQLSGAERERILSLRTGRGQAVLGVLVLPSLYQVSRSGLGRGSHREETPMTLPAPVPARTHLHVFNPQENMWRPLIQVPEEAPLRGCGLCTMYNYLFLAGGIRGSGAKAVCSNEVFCYNPLTNIWSQVRPMQQARAQLKLVALDGLLYAIGGECLYSMERYDPRTDAWTSRAPLPAGTFPVAHEAVACRGDIYVTGGHLFYRLLRYSPVKDSWDECPYSASHRRSSDMVALGGFLYRFDLLRGVGAAVMRYNTVTGSWSRAASLPLPDPAPLRCAVLGNTIYCLNHQVTATFTVSEGTAQFQAKELQPFPLGSKGVLFPFILTLPSEAQLQTSL